MDNLDPDSKNSFFQRRLGVLRMRREGKDKKILMTMMMTLMMVKKKQQAIST